MKNSGEQHIQLSVLIPNLGYSKKIFRCLDSLLKCSAEKKKYEIIVFDQSDENTSSKLEREIFQTYNGLIKFHHGNVKSLYFARHSLMEFATGEYCTFVDSDDYVDPNYVDSILKNISFYDNPDILIYSFFIDNIDGTITSRSDKDLQTEIKYPLESFVLLSSINSVWRKVFKKNLYKFRDYVSFSEIRIGEDKIFSYPIMIASKRTIVLKEKYYHYVLSPSSMMSQADLSDFIEYLQLPIHTFNREMNNKEKKMFCHFLCSFFLNHYKIALANLSDYLLLTDTVKKEMINKKININNGTTLKEKILVFMLKNNSKLLYILCKRKKYGKKQNSR